MAERPSAIEEDYQQTSAPSMPITEDDSDVNFAKNNANRMKMLTAPGRDAANNNCAVNNNEWTSCNLESELQLDFPIDISKSRRLTHKFLIKTKE